jgi:hypothetical protein
MTSARIIFLISLLIAFSTSVSAESMSEWFINREGGKLPPLIDASVPPLTPAWEDNVDFSAIRLSYAKRADFKLRCESRPNTEYFADTNAGNYGTAADLLEKWLRACPIDALGHLLVRLGYPFFVSQKLTNTAPFVDEVTAKSQDGKIGIVYFDFRWMFIRNRYELGIAH